VDVLVVGPRTFIFRLGRRGGLLVSARSQPFEAYRREMADSGSVCTAVPGWREALVLHDPEGKAGALIEEARAWTRPSPKRHTSWSRRSGHRTKAAV